MQTLCPRCTAQDHTADVPQLPFCEAACHHVAVTHDPKNLGRKFKTNGRRIDFVLGQHNNNTNTHTHTHIMEKMGLRAPKKTGVNLHHFFLGTNIIPVFVAKIWKLDQTTNNSCEKIWAPISAGEVL